MSAEKLDILVTLLAFAGIFFIMVIPTLYAIHRFEQWLEHRKWPKAKYSNRITWL